MPKLIKTFANQVVTNTPKNCQTVKIAKVAKYRHNGHSDSSQNNKNNVLFPPTTASLNRCSANNKSFSFA